MYVCACFSVNPKDMKTIHNILQSAADLFVKSRSKPLLACRTQLLDLCTINLHDLVKNNDYSEHSHSALRSCNIKDDIVACFIIINVWRNVYFWKENPPLFLLIPFFLAALLLQLTRSFLSSYNVCQAVFTYITHVTASHCQACLFKQACNSSHVPRWCSQD